MKIALLGYGRMGKTIEKIATERGHEIGYKTNAKLDEELLKQQDIAIDFSIPEAAFENITTCFKLGVPVVSGTTGWLDHLEEAHKSCLKHKSAFIYASNFSLGVNLFFELNRKLAQLLQPYPNYKASLTEVHHTKKLDQPSGTAISLAEDLMAQQAYTGWQLTNDHQIKSGSQTNPLAITAIREENVPGTHWVNYKSDIDEISIKHKANSRDGFALGAVIAAEWLMGKQGIFNMQDVLNLHEKK
jgi:4-hydroxy-tetrahydrodipicolinate reductase